MPMACAADMLGAVSSDSHGAITASFEQRTVSRLAALLRRKSPDIFCYPALDALDVPHELE